MNAWRVIVLASLAALLATTGCAERTPIRIGFIAGISGRVADLGIGGRNGAMLAVEQVNQSGGINGRPVELLIRDDEQQPEAARQAIQDLLNRQVAAIIGPMTSSMCSATWELADAAQVVMMSPTCTATLFSGRDDYFFRVISATTDYAFRAADYHVRELDHRKFAVIYDLGNRAYTESWLRDFEQRVGNYGGTLVTKLAFTSAPDAPFAELAQQLANTPGDVILLIANSVDTAQFAQQLARFGNRRPLMAAEWAATERLIELGGKAVEGMRVAQFIDRESQAPDYLAFRADFLKRFNQEPGFAGAAGYDAARVVLDALAGKPSRKSLKQYILDKRTFRGVDGPIDFTEFGDAQRAISQTIIREGRFQTLK